MNLPRLLATLAAAALLNLAASAQAQTAPPGEADLLPVEQAFAVTAKATDRGDVALDWKIAEHYYLYRGRIKTSSADDGVTLAALDLPPGEKKHDEFLGDVEVYHADFSATQKLTAPADATQIVLAVRYQGCHDIEPKICFPPHTVKLAVALPPAAAANGAALLPGGEKSSALIGTHEPLPVDQAFVYQAIAGGPHEVLARFSMPKGYYLYRDQTRFSAPGATLTPRWPEGVQHQDSHFGTTVVYFDQVDVPIEVDGASAGQPLALTATFQGCLEQGVCYPATTRTLTVALPPGDSSSNSNDHRAPMAGQQPRPAATETPGGLGALLAALFGAFVGGLILNLMPCVLPVLWLKALAILENSHSPQTARRHVLFYTAGVLLSFAIVGLAAIALRKAGLIYGWGFQLQQPLFVAILAYVILAIGLSLSGVFQFGAGLAGAGQNLAARSGPAGDFFTGVLAVVVASPCTAPFMGSALAFAFASSPWLAFLVFIMLGLGLALPFLLIGFMPTLGRFLPKPGAWMETLKQVLAFPMYLTAIWLVWVLGNQRGVDAMGYALLGVVVLGLGLWWFDHSRYRGIAYRAPALIALLLALPPLYAIANLDAQPQTRAYAPGQIAFDPGKLEDLRKNGQRVLVDIGADWCATCKINERAVLGTPAFHALLDQTHTTLMVGDWTNPDPDIEAFLARFHAVGVPLYVIYRNGDEGHALPTVLTYGLLEAELTPAAR